VNTRNIGRRNHYFGSGNRRNHHSGSGNRRNHYSGSGNRRNHYSGSGNRWPRAAKGQVGRKEKGSREPRVDTDSTVATVAT
jgi:hypothetical protein